MLASSGCCAPNITCIPSLQSPDVVIDIVVTVHKAKISVMEHINPFDGAMLALLSLADPDLQTELDPEIDIKL